MVVYNDVAVLSVVILCEGLGYLVISEASYLHYIIVILAIMLKVKGTWSCVLAKKYNL